MAANPIRGFDWAAHPEVEKQLKELWASTGSSSDIAAQLTKTHGQKFTRCMVLGRAHRLKLPQKVTVYVGSPANKKPPQLPKPKDTSPDRPVSVLPLETFPNGNGCRYIEGDPSKPGWQACGHPVTKRGSWCEYHYLRCLDIANMERQKKSKA